MKSILLSSLILGLLALPVGAQEADVPMLETYKTAAVYSLPYSFTGVLGQGSANFTGTQISGLQTPRPFRSGTPDNCDGSDGGSPFSSGTFPFDAYTLYNNSGSEQCVNVLMDQPGTSAFIVVYNNSFDPNNIILNYMADPGSSASIPFSVLVANGQKVIIVVSSVPNSAPPNYTYTVSYDVLTTTSFDRVIVDDQNRARICINTTTGAFKSQILNGSSGASGPFTGTAVVTNYGTLYTKYTSQPGSFQPFQVYVYHYNKTAHGYLYVNNPWNSVVLHDSNILNNVGGCD